MLNRIRSVLPEETELVVTRTIECAVRVHEELGPGYLEGLYQDALCIELGMEGLAFDRELAVTVHYRGRPLRAQRLDLVVEKQVLVELKATTRMEPIYQAQVLSYLKSTGLRVGLLMNYHDRMFRGSIKRFVL
ncbi:MAG: GxxExxY protein [Vicinamibacterales bacterium]